MMDELKKVNIRDLEVDVKKMGIYGGGLRRISGDFEAAKLGFNITVVDPGQFLCPYHKHYGEEELILVIEGEATVRQEDKVYKVKRDDLIFYNCGVAHQLYNHSDKPVRLLAISNNDPSDICEYPDSGKVNVRQLGQIFKSDTRVSYFSGEENPAAFWQSHDI